MRYLLIFITRAVKILQILIIRFMKYSEKNSYKIKIRVTFLKSKIFQFSKFFKPPDRVGTC